MEKMAEKVTGKTMETMETMGTMETMKTTMEKTIKISPLRISTMTVTGNWGTSLHLTELYSQLKEHIIPTCYPKEGILKFEYKGKSIGASYKDLFTRRKITNKSFFNQSTLILRQLIKKDTWKEMNIKLFANGGIQITGIPCIEFAMKGLQWLFEFFSSLPVSPFENPDKAAIQKIDVPLINTDFYIHNNDINQENIHSLFINKYNIMSTLEKTIYQGVNAKYYLNITNTQPGVCTCSTFCKGQGDGLGEFKCKRITMSIFRTGKIIITGARNMEQIYETYNFLINVIKTHSNAILIAR